MGGFFNPGIGGISGGGGGASPLTTKGDVYTYSTADARLPVGTNGQVLSADSTEATGLKWIAAAGTGDVVGPASATDNALVRYDLTTGKLIQNGTITQDDSGNLANVGTINGNAVATGTNTGDQTSMSGISDTQANFNTACSDGTFAFTANNLSVFAATTSAQLAGVISDETGTGALVFGTAPTLTGAVTAANTTSVASLAITASAAVDVATPTSGDLWWNGTNLYFYDGAANQDLLAGGGGGLTWGDSIADTSGTGITLTISDSASAGTIAQKIVFGNTQTNNLIGLDVDLGTDAQGHKGIKIKTNAGQQVAFDVDMSAGCSSNGGFRIDSYDSTTQNTSASNTKSLVLGRNYNTNSARYTDLLYIYNQDNAGTGYNTGFYLENLSTTPRTPLETYKGDGCGMALNQRGVGGTCLGVFGWSSVNSNNDGIVHFLLDDSQTGASIMQRIDLGTSAQGHTGLYIDMVGASTSQRGIHIDLTSTGTGTGIEFSGSNASAKVFEIDTSLTQAGGTATGTTTKEIKITVSGTAYVIDCKSEA